MGAGAHCIVPCAVPDHPGLGSLGTCHLPAPSGLWAGGGAWPSHKSHLSKCDFHLPLHSRAWSRSRSVPFISQCQSRRAGQSKANLPPASASCPCLLPLASVSFALSLLCDCNRLADLLTCLPPHPRPSLLLLSPARLPSKPPALRRQREPDLGPPRPTATSNSTSFPHHLSPGASNDTAQQIKPPTAAIPCQTTTLHSTTHAHAHSHLAKSYIHYQQHFTLLSVNGQPPQHNWSQVCGPPPLQDTRPRP